jgi:hypothetical protein
MHMEIFIKLTVRDYHRLRDQVVGSPAQAAINKATPIDYAMDGVQFTGYTIPCTDEQARAILATAKQCCPAIAAEVERAIELARAAPARSAKPL